MNPLLTRRAALLSTLLLLLAPAIAPAAKPLRVMSFNIRLATPKDIPSGNAWPTRRELLFKTIEAYDPDLLGTQEVLPVQGAELKERLKGYTFVGVPRNDGKTSGEMAAVFFRTERFEKVRDGTFWLSPTPDVVGSKGWDADLPRVVTWVELRDKLAGGGGDGAGGKRLFFFNTHFDHLGRQARLESATLLRKKILEIAGPDAPVIVTGDFNAPENSEPYKRLLGQPADPQLLTDTRSATHATSKPTTREYTFHGFTGRNDKPSRIDWILCSDHFRVSATTIDATNDNGRYPSDHFPITATLLPSP
jgi:endonuclease/exonuclease/phosphatase family metal-dependent hydrolase